MITKYLKCFTKNYNINCNPVLCNLISHKCIVTNVIIKFYFTSRKAYRLKGLTVSTHPSTVTGSRRSPTWVHHLSCQKR